MAKETFIARESGVNPINAMSGVGNRMKEVDDYFGFESDGDFVNWPALQSFGGNSSEIADMIDKFTDYFVEANNNDYANVGYGRDIRTRIGFDVLPKGTPDGDEDVFRKTIKIDEKTKIGDIFKKLGYRQRERRR